MASSQACSRRYTGIEETFPQMEYSYVEGSILHCAAYCFPVITASRIVQIGKRLNLFLFSEEEVTSGLKILAEGNFVKEVRRGFKLTRKAKNFCVAVAAPMRMSENKTVGCLCCFAAAFPVVRKSEQRSEPVVRIYFTVFCKKSLTFIRRYGMMCA